MENPISFVPASELAEWKVRLDALETPYIIPVQWSDLRGLVLSLHGEAEGDCEDTDTSFSSLNLLIDDLLQVISNYHHVQNYFDANNSWTNQSAGEERLYDYYVHLFCYFYKRDIQQEFAYMAIPNLDGLGAALSYLDLARQNPGMYADFPDFLDRCRAVAERHGMLL